MIVAALSQLEVLSYPPTYVIVNETTVAACR
jgi:hypothetical protein